MVMDIYGLLLMDPPYLLFSIIKCHGQKDQNNQKQTIVHKTQTKHRRNILLTNIAHQLLKKKKK